MWFTKKKRKILHHPSESKKKTFERGCGQISVSWKRIISGDGSFLYGKQMHMQSIFRSWQKKRNLKKRKTTPTIKQNHVDWKLPYNDSKLLRFFYFQFRPFSNLLKRFNLVPRLLRREPWEQGWKRLCLHTGKLSLRLGKADILFLFIILFPPFTALNGSAATFVAVLVDGVVHCRMYTCGG